MWLPLPVMAFTARPACAVSSESFSPAGLSLNGSGPAGVITLEEVIAVTIFLVQSKWGGNFNMYHP